MKCGTNGFKRKYIKLDLDFILISYSIRHGLNAIRMEPRSNRVNEHLTLYEFYFLFFMEKIAAVNNPLDTSFLSRRRNNSPEWRTTSPRYRKSISLVMRGFTGIPGTERTSTHNPWHNRVFHKRIKMTLLALLTTLYSHIFAVSFFICNIWCEISVDVIRSGLVQFLSNDTAKMMLAILAFLYCEEFVKNPNRKVDHFFICGFHVNVSCCYMENWFKIRHGGYRVEWITCLVTSNPLLATSSMSDRLANLL